MSWITKLFGHRRSVRLPGIEPGDCWEITPPESMAECVRALGELVTDGSVLYIESGVAPPTEIGRFLKAHASGDDFRIRGGTLLPTPACNHMAITKESLEGLARLAEEIETPKGSIHLHVHRDGEMLLESFDAFLDPMYVSAKIPEDRVRRFCERTRTSFKRSGERHG